MDPGNYGTDIQEGMSLNYSLLWVVWLSSGMAMLPSIPFRKTCHSDGPIVTRSYTIIMLYWLAAEAATAATDLAEYLGTVIALNLLFGIPMIYAATFGALDVLIILTLATQRRFYLIERLRDICIDYMIRILI